LDLSKHSYEFKGVRILGLESATFKNSNCKSFPNGCKEAYKYQLEKMESVRDELTINNTERKPSIIFTHIPDLYDPYKFDPNNPKQSWVLRQDARNTWDQTIAQNPLLKGVFAGHFHSQDRNDYGQRGNLIPKDPTRNSDLPFIVCPPLASKFQTIDQQTAQGLLIGTINPSSNAISYSITFRGFSAKP